MQYIDNDMDDLYSKAGRQYPLKTDSADWEAVRSQLAADTPATAPPTKKPFWYGWFLIALIPLVFLFTREEKEKQTDQNQIETKGNLKTSISDKAPAISSNGPKPADASPSVENKLSTRALNDRNETEQKRIDGNVSDEKNKTNQLLILNNSSAKQRALQNNKGRFSSINYNNVQTQPKSGELSNKLKRRTRVGLDITSGNGRRGKPGTSNGKLSPETGNEQPNIAVHSDASLKIGGGKSGSLQNKTPRELLGKTGFPGLARTGWLTGDRSALFNDSRLILSGIAQPLNPKPSKPFVDPDRYFYVGLSAAPDLSFIKSQAVKNVGYDFGLLIGYHFSKRLAVEGGFLWDRKKYFTDGKYFDKNSAGIASYVWVKSVDGSCNMFEIPLSLRYDLSLKPNTFVVSAGFNSYLMKKEDYSYKAMANGSWYNGDHSYKNSGNHFFASLMFTAGYSLKLVRNTNFRLEPYYKLPLKKIGTGNMPLTSTGINISLIQRIP